MRKGVCIVYARHTSHSQRNYLEKQFGLEMPMLVEDNRWTYYTNYKSGKLDLLRKEKIVRNAGLF